MGAVQKEDDTAMRRKVTARGPQRGKIRGYSSNGREQDIERCLPGLAFFHSHEPQALVSALRAMRRARHGRSGSYDPARHAALLRLTKKAPPETAALVRNRPVSKIR